jgi:dienelactone hydrolase
VVYGQDGKGLRGFLAYDDGLKGKRPGVLVVHEWWGLNDFARERALKLAGLG